MERQKIRFASGGTECAGGHYEPFLGGHEQAVEAELSFLRRNLLEHARADRDGAEETRAALRRPA
jgi:hypothetical protein